MNSLPSSVERENLGQFLLENLQDITDKLNQIVIDSDRIILDNLLQETKILFEQGFNSIHLCTGYSPEDFAPMPWIKSIRGKAFPT